METHIKVNLPLNLSTEDEDLFKPYSSFVLKTTPVQYLNNIFVMYTGVCQSEHGIVKSSHHSAPESPEEITKHLIFFQEAIALSPNLLVEFDDDQTYLVIHHSWFTNYYHWICEGIPRLWQVKKQLHEMVLLFPDELNNIEFVRESLRPFRFKNVVAIDTCQCLSVKNLCLPPIKPVCDSYDSRVMNDIREFYRAYNAANRLSNLTFGKKLFLSRCKSARRNISNNAEVEELVTRFGFTVIYNEDLSFWDQLSVYSNANCLVSAHGAGLTNMIFMEANSSIVELYKRKSNSNDWHSFAYWYLADTLQFKYYQHSCEPIDPGEHFLTADINVDIEKLEQTLIQLTQD